MSTEFQPSQWKPVARTLTSLDKIPWDYEPWIQVKADGEMWVLVYNRNGDTYSSNLWMRKRGVEIPAIRQAKALLDQSQVQQAIILGEAHAMDGERFLNAPELNHRLKGNGGIDTVHFGAWDLQELDHKLLDQPWPVRIAQVPFPTITPTTTLTSEVPPVPLVHVLPYRRALDLPTTQVFYSLWVDQKHAEGLYCRDNRNSLFKYKPYFSIDAAVIGINKTPLYAKNMVSSLKVGLLMNSKTLEPPQNIWVDLGDVASGIDPELRKTLWSLTSDIRKDMGQWYQITPKVVVEVQMTQLFHARRPCYIDTGDGQFTKAGIREFYSMRHPRLIRFRTDKTVRYEDIRDAQLPELLEELVL